MSVIGVQELEEHAGEILRRVIEDGESIELAKGGRVVALLSPVVSRPRATPEEIAAYFAELDALAEQIGKHVPEGVTVEDIMHDIRRDL